MGILVSLSTLLRMVALGFALGIVVGLYFGIGGSPEPGSACGPGRSVTQQCAPPEPAPATLNPDAAP